MSLLELRSVDKIFGGLHAVRSVSFNDRQPHGLMVRIELPVRQQMRQTAA